jgi:hypothetical protein
MPGGLFEITLPCIPTIFFIDAHNNIDTRQFWLVYSLKYNEIHIERYVIFYKNHGIFTYVFLTFKMTAL